MIRACRMWEINRRRVNRWRSKLAQGASLDNKKPGPKSPVHKLLAAEKAAVLQMARAEQYVDLSHRMLTVTGWDLKLFFVSFSSVYRILRSEGLMCMRGKHRHHNGRSFPPVRKELTGANQRWCWDISYLLTYEKGLYLYLYLFWMNIPEKPSTGWSAGIRPLSKRVSFLKAHCFARTSWICLRINVLRLSTIVAVR